MVLAVPSRTCAPRALAEVGNAVNSASPAETAGGTTADIRARARPACWLCGAEGQPFLADLRDRLFGAPGTWALRRCMNARWRMVWMDPQPIEEDLHLAYGAYYTHASAATAPSRIREIVRSGYLQGALGYTTGVGNRWHRYVRVLAHAYPSGASSIQSDI